MESWNSLTINPRCLIFIVSLKVWQRPKRGKKLAFRGRQTYEAWQLSQNVKNPWELRANVTTLRSLAADNLKEFQKTEQFLPWLWAPTLLQSIDDFNLRIPTSNLITNKQITWSTSNTWFDGVVLCWSNFSWIPSSPKKIWHLALEPRKLKGNSRFSPPHSRPTCHKKVVNKAPFVAYPLRRLETLAKKRGFSSKINPT